MEDLERMAIFARVVAAKNFSEASRRLGISKSAVSKAVTQLERSVGARLLTRTTRAMSLTEAGAAFYAHCARIVEEAEQARLAVGRFHSEPRGLLRISASVAFGTLHIAPALPLFLERFPEVRIDMAIGISREPAPNLVARRLAPVNRKIVATPGYFERRGVPASPAELARHNCLTYTHSHPPDTW